MMAKKEKIIASTVVLAVIAVLVATVLFSSRDRASEGGDETLVPEPKAGKVEKTKTKRTPKASKSKVEVVVESETGSEEDDSQVPELTEEEKQESVTFSGTLEHPVDVGPYTQLIPSGNYAFILKEGKAFFLDITQKDTLLVCSFAEKIQSLPAVLPQDQPDPRLIYQNDRYMAVFTSLNIEENKVVVSKKLLFKKP